VREAPKSLARARAAVTPVLAAASATLAPELRRVVEYHWGWCDAEGRPTPSGGGKALRPTLAVLSTEAVGEPAACALAGATAVELIHDFTLLHDDVMDQDRERRKRPTAWTVFGIGPALCGGDALVLLAQRVLLNDASPARIAALAALGEAAETVIAGQALDLAYEGRVDLTERDWERMAGKKTAALLGCAASIGAILAQGSDVCVASLREFGCALGLAFQAVDDWLGIWGCPERTGKPVASDLRQRKGSLPIVTALAHESTAAAALRAFLQEREAPDDAAIARAMDALEACGAEPATRAVADREYARARQLLEAAPVAAGARDELLELASFVVERES
jgi:geranylgeranyl diphosphate synthase type I